MPPLTDGPKIGDPPTVLQSADVNELNRALAEAQEGNARLINALSQIEALTAGGKGQSVVNMVAQLALNSDVPIDGLECQASQDAIIRETLLEVMSHAVDGVVSVESIRAMEAAIGDLPVEDAVPAQHAARIEELERALQNICYMVARISPPPYGHRCRWCDDCTKRAKADARAALASAPAPEQPEHPDTRRLSDAASRASKALKLWAELLGVLTVGQQRTAKEIAGWLDAAMKESTDE